MNHDSQKHRLAAMLVLSSAFRDSREHEKIRWPFSKLQKTSLLKQSYPGNRAICMARPLLHFVIKV
jgi:hypothetical protein